MKIVDVCAFYTPKGGGVRTYVEQKLVIGPQLGHDITILAPGERYEVFERGPQARIITLPSPRFPLDGNYWYFDDEPALHSKLDDLAPDFVEVSSPWRSPLFVARWRPEVPRSLIMHADPLSAYAYRWFTPLFSRETIDRSFAPFWAHLRQLGESFDTVVCASGELRDRLRGGGVANTALHPMGIEPGVFSPARRDPEMRRKLLELCSLPEDASLLLGVGRLAAEKRWPLVIAAAAAAGHSKPVGLVILGEGNKLRSLRREIGPNPHIKLLRPVRDRELYAPSSPVVTLWSMAVRQRPFAWSAPKPAPAGCRLSCPTAAALPTMARTEPDSVTKQAMPPARPRLFFSFSTNHVTR